ncbi:MAG: ribosome recycling factor [Desulfurivibrionaceae bacterium]|nr:ribosome recycling factor [Desulfobulbales bacterium]MDT8334202.1 ribosome recycling factor [Desulfurivibrionaceae bacterium]
MSEVLESMSEKMESSIDAYKRELARIRTGRASTSLLESIKIDAYGSQMPINQVATITIPESRLIQIQAWDTQLLGPIEKAIQKANLGLNPVNDGKLLRVAIPQLTEERRKELVKQVKKITEEYRVAVRNSRREAIDSLKKQKNNKEITEDAMFGFQEDAQKETDKFIGIIDELMAVKEKEVMEV